MAHRRFLAFAVLVLLAAVPAAGRCASPPPRPAVEVGYRVRTFHSDFKPFDRTVDRRMTGEKGAQWRLCQFFGWKADPGAVAPLPGGGAAIEGAPGSAGCTLSSVGRAPAPAYFHGVAFGGGAYFEASLAFDPAGVDARKGWPAWWTLAVEHLAELPRTDVPGKGPKFEHFIEPDIFEADIGPGTPDAYGGDVHEWWGQWKTECPKTGFCTIDLPYRDVARPTPPHTDFRAFHRYGLLWVPAAGARPGRIAYYFDGRQVGPAVTWRAGAAAALPAGPDDPAAFSVIDRQHLALILGSGLGERMKVRSVNVWQASARNNLRR